MSSIRPTRRTPARARDWSVYVVRTHAGALYTGIALDVARRLAAHEAGLGAKALRGRGPLTLVYERAVGTRSIALRVEHRIKRLPRTGKELLVMRRPTRHRLLRSLGLPARRASTAARR